MGKIVRGLPEQWESGLALERSITPSNAMLVLMQLAGRYLHVLVSSTLIFLPTLLCFLLPPATPPPLPPARSPAFNQLASCSVFLLASNPGYSFYFRSGRSVGRSPVSLSVFPSSCTRDARSCAVRICSARVVCCVGTALPPPFFFFSPLCCGSVRHGLRLPPQGSLYTCVHESSSSTSV